MYQETIRALDASLQTSHQWFRQLQESADLKDEAEAYSVLRHVLHAVRDRLPADEAAHLGAELPLVIRGIYYEGWKPSATPDKTRTLEAFLKTLGPVPTARMALTPEDAVRHVFALLDDHISAGEARDVRQALPEAVRELWHTH